MVTHVHLFGPLSHLVEIPCKLLDSGVVEQHAADTISFASGGAAVWRPATGHRAYSHTFP